MVYSFCMSEPQTTEAQVSADWDVIHVYTRAQAIEDGVLVDVTEQAREAGFVIPVAFTSAAWADLVRWDNPAGTPPQDEIGRLWDVLTMAVHFARRYPRQQTTECEVARVLNRPRASRPHLAPFVMHCGPGDNAEPVMTIMLPGED